jgi:hypothetical protein
LLKLAIKYYTDIVNLLKGEPYKKPTDSIKESSVYPFSLMPIDYQPSGSVNLSRIDTNVIVTNIEPEPAHINTPYVYAMAYNFLRIMSGMGSLSYSNDNNNMSFAERELARLTNELVEIRQKVYNTSLGKLKIKVHKDLRNTILIKIIPVPYEVANIINNYI